MDPVKVYVAGKTSVDVACPGCGRTSSLPLDGAKSPQGCETQCGCGIVFPVVFEKRRFFRKPMLLSGTCFSRRDPAGGAPIKIVNLSRAGIQFTKDTGETLEPSETIKLRFRVKPPSHVIRCSALVVNAEGNSIGARFLNLDLESQKLLNSALARH